MVGIVIDRGRTRHKADQQSVDAAFPSGRFHRRGDQVILLDLRITFQVGVHVNQLTVLGVGLDITFPHVIEIGHGTGGDLRLQLLEIILAASQQFHVNVQTGARFFVLGIKLLAQFGLRVCVTADQNAQFLIGRRGRSATGLFATGGRGRRTGRNNQRAGACRH